MTQQVLPAMPTTRTTISEDAEEERAAARSRQHDDLPEEKAIKRRKRFSNKQKVEIIDKVQAEGNNVPSVAKAYGIPETTIYGWMKLETDLKEKLVSQKRIHHKANVREQMPKLNKMLLSFCSSVGRDEDEDFIVSSSNLAYQALRYKEQLLDNPSIQLDEKERKHLEDFKASKSWAKKWLRSHGHSRSTVDDDVADVESHIGEYNPETNPHDSPGLQATSINAQDSPGIQAASRNDNIEEDSSQRYQVVCAWLLEAFDHDLSTRDLGNYASRLVEDGIDSVNRLENEMEEDDYSFMKKIHKRQLTRIRRQRRNGGN